MLPTVTLPKLRLVGLADKAPAVTLVPDSGMFSVGFEPSDVIVNVPLAVPAVCGENVTVRVVLCESARVSGVVIPLI